MFPLVSIVFINYNTAHLIDKCLKSVLNQSYKNLELIFIDNASGDQSVDLVKNKFGSKVQIIANKENLGYAKAANQGINRAKGKYVWIMNLDIIFDENYLKESIDKMETDEKIGVLGGKLLKYDFKENKKTKIIDSVGLMCFRNRRVVDFGQGLEDKGQFDESSEMFGISGAAPIYRKSALKDIEVLGEIFDGDFFMYKEDIDVSWRLNLYGWKCSYLPAAIAWHGRGTGVLKRYTHLEVLKSRKNLSRAQKFYAYKNQRLMMVKNELVGNVLRDLIPILGREILILGYIVLREPYVLKALMKFLYQMPRALKKRKTIMKNRKTDAKQMKKWFLLNSQIKIK